MTVLAKSGEAAKAGPIGLAVILLLCIACYFLFKSMSKHMKRVRENFPVDAPPVRPAAPADQQRSDQQRSDQQRSDLQRAELLRKGGPGAAAALPAADGGSGPDVAKTP